MPNDECDISKAVNTWNIRTPDVEKAVNVPEFQKTVIDEALRSPEFSHYKDAQIVGSFREFAVQLCKNNKIKQLLTGEGK